MLRDFLLGGRYKSTDCMNGERVTFARLDRTYVRMFVPSKNCIEFSRTLKKRGCFLSGRLLLGRVDCFGTVSVVHLFFKVSSKEFLRFISFSGETSPWERDVSLSVTSTPGEGRACPFLRFMGKGCSGTVRVEDSSGVELAGVPERLEFEARFCWLFGLHR